MDNKLMNHGAFSWFELMTKDVAAAKKFYADLFNWQYRETLAENRTYHVIRVADEDVAGLMSMPPAAQNMPPCWGIYLTVEESMPR